MKAISLISGGLDSILAARLIKEQGIEIIPLNFKIPFCHRDKNLSSKGTDKLTVAGNTLGLDIKIVDIGNDFLKLLGNPKYGFGSNMNPCIDCKILMLSKAGELMKAWNAAFIVTGEVLGQRPMSQHRKALKIIEEKSGMEGLVVRPLSAKLLSETLPEKQSWISRDKLLNFSGRRRRPQMELAARLDIEEYSTPAGGCLLTDPQFSKRLKDLIVYRELSVDNIELLKIGRHFRLTPDAKLVVGRDEEEDNYLASLARGNDYLFMPTDELAGPTSLGRGTFNEELIKAACRITCYYCDLNGANQADLTYRIIPAQESRVIKASPILEEKLYGYRI